MRLADKIKYLRVVEGQLRGLGREMSQKEVIAALASEMQGTVSQPYLSQIENGQRKHLTNTTRLLLARFFKVHPGYLVDDPEGFQTELITDLRDREDKLDLWLISGAEQFGKDPELAAALIKIARYQDTRKCLLLLATVLDTPDLVDRLFNALAPADEQAGDAEQGVKEHSNDTA